ncbi:hypothetical protein F2P45_04925 [Massilia sp. CCM 8733]|uniref:Lipoprotein n=1 Tax=Massilia mucilaginosa TaxID=2609282 RepID=A0ABX0NNF3_9BURK|nr:hypothetical protein [Massilia mucilaginosa]NHZ88371.1 hypothetical protein [Massilia mucilaginosa]
MLKKPLACASMALACVACVACTVPAARTTDNTSHGAASLVSGNTMFVTNRFGPSAIYFDPSGRVRHTAGSTLSEGSWRADKDQICTTVDPTPERVTPEYCLDLAGKKLGTEWTGNDPKNGKLVFLITPGEKSARH